MSTRSAAASRARPGEEPFSRANTMLRRLTWIRMVPVEPPDSQEPAGGAVMIRNAGVAAQAGRQRHTARVRASGAAAVRRTHPCRLRAETSRWRGRPAAAVAHLTAWRPAESQAASLRSLAAGGSGAGGRQRRRRRSVGRAEEGAARAADRRLVCPSPWTPCCGRWAAACRRPAPLAAGTLPAAAPAAPCCSRLAGCLIDSSAPRSSGPPLLPPPLPATSAGVPSPHSCSFASSRSTRPASYRCRPTSDFLLAAGPVAPPAWPPPHPTCARPCRHLACAHDGAAVGPTPSCFLRCVALQCWAYYRAQEVIS